MQAQASLRGPGGGCDLGSAIRDARLQRAMTQEELALESGLQRKTIYQIERGKTDPRLGSVRRIADAMGLQAADLLAPTTDERRTDA